MASATALALARFNSITRRASCIKRRFSFVGRFANSSSCARVGAAFAFALGTTFFFRLLLLDDGVEGGELRV